MKTVEKAIATASLALASTACASHKPDPLPEFPGFNPSPQEELAHPNVEALNLEALKIEQPVLQIPFQQPVTEDLLSATPQEKEPNLASLSFPKPSGVKLGPVTIYPEGVVNGALIHVASYVRNK